MTEAKYTKHYFIEGERVVSKIGGGFDGAPYMPTDEPLEFISVAPDQFVSDLYEMVNRDINCTGDLASWKIEETIKPAHNDDDEVEKKQYFYHPDHLGSSSFITNAIGYAEQLPIAIGVQYLPFGELFVNQQNSTYDTRYKFSAKELDNETNYSYFGARYYDSDLSVFLSVDRYADKYPNLTPYHYCAGNPVNFVDINGDSLWINHKGNQILYNKGVLFNKDGSLYTGKVKGFLRDSRDALITMGETEEGSGMIQELQNSKNNFKIEKGESKFIADNNFKAYANQYETDPSLADKHASLISAGIDFTGGSGGTIYWNPKGYGLPIVGGFGINATTDLGHELFHGLDANRGLLDDRPHLGVVRSEWQAVYRENLLRAQLGAPLRTHYGYSVTPSGDYIGPTGPFMLTPSNRPLKPSWYSH